MIVYANLFTLSGIGSALMGLLFHRLKEVGGFRLRPWRYAFLIGSAVGSFISAGFYAHAGHTGQTTVSVPVQVLALMSALANLSAVLIPPKGFTKRRNDR
ncbi:MAG: hypothetical protein ACYCYO_01830 [Bacilli bacterium]